MPVASARACVGASERGSGSTWVRAWSRESGCVGGPAVEAQSGAGGKAAAGGQAGTARALTEAAPAAAGFNFWAVTNGAGEVGWRLGGASVATPSAGGSDAARQACCCTRCSAARRQASQAASAAKAPASSSKGNIQMLVLSTWARRSRNCITRSDLALFSLRNCATVCSSAVIRSAAAEAADAAARAALAACATASSASCTALACGSGGVSSMSSFRRAGWAAGLADGLSWACAVRAAAARRSARATRRGVALPSAAARGRAVRRVTPLVLACGSVVASARVGAAGLAAARGLVSDTAGTVSAATGASAACGACSGGSAKTTKRRTMRAWQPTVRSMSSTGSSMACCVITRTRARSTPTISTTVRTRGGGSRRSPTVTCALTHCGSSGTPGSRRTWTAKSSGWPITAPVAPAPMPAADATDAARPAKHKNSDNKQGREIGMRGKGDTKRSSKRL